MKFSYSPIIFRRSILTTFSFLTIAAGVYLIRQEFDWKVVAALLFTLLYLLIICSMIVIKYVEINATHIKVRNLPFKDIALSELTEVQVLKDEYVFKTPTKTAFVVLSKIHPKDQDAFKASVAKLKVKEN